MVNRNNQIRPGFTLVEVIVVMTILSILFALAAGVVFRAQDSANQAKAGIELQQLAAGIETFKQKYGFYPPSRFRLKNAISSYNVADPYECACKNYLLTMFPRIATQVTPVPTGQPTYIGWTGDTSPTSSIDLKGPECLVFFLGGRVFQSSTGNKAVGALGFLTDPSNPWPDPTDATKPARQKGITLYEFDNTRLLKSPFNTPLNRNNPVIFVYLDAFASGQSDMPYFYFTSYKAGNDYNAADVISSTIDLKTGGLPPGWSYPTFQLSPFMNSQFITPTSPQNTFYNPTSFQLVSAGKNKRPGNFATLTTSPHRPGFILFQNGDFLTTQPTAPTNVREDEAGDNLCNFHVGKMGVPQ